MTETTEEKDLITAIERCIEGDLGPAYDLSNGLHMSPGEAASFHKLINGAFQKLEDKVTSLTNERDELKSQNDFLQKGIKELQDRLDSAQDRNSKRIIENKNLESQLSNREEEIKELKEALKKISELEHQAAEPFSICDADYNYVADQDRIIAEAKSIALASLQSKEGEE